MEELLKDAKRFYESHQIDKEVFKDRFNQTVRMHEQKSKRMYNPRLIATVVVFLTNLLIPYGNPICRSMGL